MTNAGTAVGCLCAGTVDIDEVVTVTGFTATVSAGKGVSTTCSSLGVGVEAATRLLRLKSVDRGSE